MSRRRATRAWHGDRERFLVALKDDLLKACNDIATSTWNPRDGRTVPNVDTIALAEGAVTIDGSVMYADLANSTGLVDSCKTEFVAQVTRVFLYVAAQLIKHTGGAVRSFDGDRVMGVFLGDNHADSAAKAAFKLRAARDEVILPTLRKKWSLDESSWKFNYGAGLDTSSITVIKAGVRGDNDLIWLGSCANHAATLSGRRTPGYATYATGRFFSATSYKQNTDGTPTWARSTDNACVMSNAYITL
jgi:adenylate cyclase